MKRKLFPITAAVALLALGACTGKQATTADTSTNPAGNTDKVYTGVLPAADAEGVRYTVLLDYDDDTNGGDYDLVQTYFNTDSTGVVQDVASFATEGDFSIGTAPSGQKYLKLSGDGAGYMYFLVDGDNALIMTGEDLTPTETPGMNYTLKAAQ